MMVEGRDGRNCGGRGYGEEEYLKSYINNKCDSELGDTVKIRGRLLIALSIIGILSCMLVPTVNAETFDIGTKISESDLELRGRKLIYFDSKTTVYTEPDYIDYIPLILDGNESTGIDHDFGPGHEVMWIELMFPYAFNVTNITVKPSFGGGTSIYTLYLNSDGLYSPWLAEQISTEETFQINCNILGIWLQLDTGGTNHQYFNDVIVNYTPALSSLDELQDQIDNLTTQLDLLNTRINELNNSINTLNFTYEEIFKNVTNVFESYNQLNESFTNLNTDIKNLNSCVYQLESENAAFRFEVENLTTELENLTLEVETLKSTERERIIEKQADNSLVYAAFMSGILGIILAFVAIILISKKSSSPHTPAEKEEPKDLITPEKNDKLS